MSKISKLPWIFHPAVYASWGVCIKCSERGSDGVNKTIAHCVEANGILMTAAPQLLEACEEAYTHLCILLGSLGELTNKSDVELLDKLRLAIRQAGGHIIDAKGKEVK